MPETGLHVALKAAVYDKIVVAPDKWTARELEEQFHALVAENRARVVRLQNEGLPRLQDAGKLVYARNCVPYGFSLKPLVQLRCRITATCPFCYAYRLKEAYTRLEGVWNHRDVNHAFWAFRAVGRKTIGETDDFINDPDRWKKLQEDLRDAALVWGRTASLEAKGWWQHMHYHPTDESSTTFDVTWQALAFGKATVVRRMSSPEQGFEWESGVEKFKPSDSKVVPHDVAEFFGNSLSFPIEILRGNVQVAARLEAMGQVEKTRRFTSGGAYTIAESRVFESKREFPKYAVPQPLPKPVQRSITDPIKKPPAAELPEAPPQPAQEAPILYGQYMDHPTFKAIDAWLAANSINSTPAQRHVLYFKFLEAQVFNAELTLEKFLSVVGEVYMVKDQPPDMWFPEALVNAHCPTTTRTAKKNNVNPWTDPELADLLQPAVDVQHMLRTAGQPVRPLTDLVTMLVARRNAANPRPIDEPPSTPLLDAAEAAAAPPPVVEVVTPKPTKIAAGQPGPIMIGTPVIYTFGDAATARQLRGVVTSGVQDGERVYYDVLEEFGEWMPGLSAANVHPLGQDVPTPTPGPDDRVEEFPIAVAPVMDLPEWRSFVQRNAEAGSPTAVGALLSTTSYVKGDLRLRFMVRLGEHGPYAEAELVRGDKEVEVIGRTRPRTRSIYGEYSFPTKHNIFARLIVVGEPQNGPTYNRDWRRNVGSLPVQPAVAAG